MKGVRQQSLLRKRNNICRNRLRICLSSSCANLGGRRRNNLMVESHARIVIQCSESLPTKAFGRVIKCGRWPPHSLQSCAHCLYHDYLIVSLEPNYTVPTPAALKPPTRVKRHHLGVSDKKGALIYSPKQQDLYHKDPKIRYPNFRKFPLKTLKNPFRPQVPIIHVSPKSRKSHTPTVNPRKLEHGFRRICDRIPYTLP